LATGHDDRGALEDDVAGEGDHRGHPWSTNTVSAKQMLASSQSAIAIPLESMPMYRGKVDAGP
jgi:hypothetical protein